VTTKVVAIGIGSVVFGVELLRDFFQTPELQGAELWLSILTKTRSPGWRDSPVA
jgi:alpha-galactosidase/6-phospho-beta-glucosidase family protein